MFFPVLGAFAQVVGFITGPKPHALAHGKDLMSRLAVKIKLPEARKLVTHDKKRPLTMGDVATIQLERVTSDVLCLKDVPVDISCWRFGLNRVIPQNHEEVMSKLAQQELMKGELAWSQSADGMAARLS